MSKSRSSSSNPRKFAEKIALLNKSEAETTAQFEKILKEVEETTRVPPQPHQAWYPPTRSASFSNRLARDSGPQHQHQQHGAMQLQGRGQNHNTYGYNQLEPSGFFGQPPGQFQPVANQMENVRHQQQQQFQHHHHHQPQHRTPIYVNQHDQQPNSFLNQPVALADPTTIQPSIEVPNIEIFSIEDEYQQQQLQQRHQHLQITTPIPANETQDSLTNGHYRDDCSDSSPITLARSLPNIASLSVSSPHTQGANQTIMQPVVVSQRLVLPMNTGHLSASPSANSLLSNSSANPAEDGYHRLLDLGGDWYNGEEAHSLPPIQDQSLNCVGNLQDHQHLHRSSSQLARVDSWQQVAVNSAPSSAASTPPFVQTAGPYIDQQQQQHSPQQHSPQQQQSPQQQVVHSAESSPQRQQHSPQSLHQDQYYSLQPIQTNSSKIRASSTTNISKNPAGDNLLGTPLINNNLSKSSEACYDYQDEFIPNDIVCNHMGDPGGGGDVNYIDSNSGLQYVNTTSPTTNPVARSFSEKNIETNHQNHW